MIHLWWTHSINKKYAIDLAFLYTYRSFEDGISFIDIVADWDRYESDHNPSFRLAFAICNYMIFDITIYNKNHIGDK